MSCKIDILCDIRSFDKLTKKDLYEILKLRQKVFVVEQNCSYLDADGLDYSAYHLLVKNKENKLIAYLRIIPKPDQFILPSIGRVLVAKAHRKDGLGKQIVNKALEFAFDKFPANEVQISAQKYLLSFYRKIGFKDIGEEYLEDGIPHIKMKIFRHQLNC